MPSSRTLPARAQFRNPAIRQIAAPQYGKVDFGRLPYGRACGGFSECTLFRPTPRVKTTADKLTRTSLASLNAFSGIHRRQCLEDISRQSNKQLQGHQPKKSFVSPELNREYHDC